MFNPIEEKRRLVKERISKSFDSGINLSEEMSLEKAWNVGDEKQYQGVTYYVHAFNAKGQPLWRKKKDGGNSDKKAGASTNAAKVDITKIPDAEYKRIIQTLEKKNPDHSDAERYLEEEAMSDKELKNFHAVAEHFKNSSEINKMTQEYCKKWAELAKQEMQYRNKGKKDKVSEKDGSNTKHDSAGGYKTEPFKGAAKVDSLKVGDKLQTRSGKIYTVKSVTNNDNNTVDIVIDNGSKIGGGVFVQTYNKNSYIGATKVDQEGLNNSSAVAGSQEKDENNSMVNSDGYENKSHPKIKRINELNSKMYDTGLSDDEYSEYNKLREELRQQKLKNKNFMKRYKQNHA